MRVGLWGCFFFQQAELLLFVIWEGLLLDLVGKVSWSLLMRLCTAL